MHGRALTSHNNLRTNVISHTHTHTLGEYLARRHIHSHINTYTHTHAQTHTHTHTHTHTTQTHTHTHAHTHTHHTHTHTAHTHTHNTHTHTPQIVFNHQYLLIMCHSSHKAQKHRWCLGATPPAKVQLFKFQGSPPPVETVTSVWLCL